MQIAQETFRKWQGLLVWNIGWYWGRELGNIVEDYQRNRSEDQHSNVETKKRPLSEIDK